MSQLSPEEARFQRQLVTRIKRGQIAYNALVKQFYDAQEEWILHSDEQKVLADWQINGAIQIDEQRVTMSPHSEA